ncbi:hypothetical protein Zmor_008911 [Zophobas morio]|uniref:Uncharacterized protein n=1 Tax=Zophobas morio TaxID=2755281 RepID=A0AA38HIF9_9CUCU|nr:hypothetical protein Zmor_008911 [Zophobas morio]
MAKDLENAVKITDGNMQAVIDALNEGKTVICAVEKGPMIQKTLETGYSDYMKAHYELLEEGGEYGVCGCGKPADALVAA